MSFKDRKQERKEHYEKYIKGWKSHPCCACNGSGRYDSFGSPKCGACDGTGKEKNKPCDKPTEGNNNEKRSKWVAKEQIENERPKKRIQQYIYNIRLSLWT